MTTATSAITPASFSNFGDLLRYLRKRAELSQRELALHVGYHYSYMSRIENNEHLPDPATLMARFVPALDLEKEPEWTRRLLELATFGGERNGNNPASSEPTVESSSTESDSSLDLFPVSLTPLLGRQSEITSLTETLSRQDMRLITLIGPPGVGKTRLAVQVATEAAGMFAHGLSFIDLAPITDAASFLPALAQNLGVNEIVDMPLITRLAQALRQKNILLVLDNFEQLVDAAPQLYQLLSNTSQVKVLVTSRVPLHIAGENQFTVQPLSMPSDDLNVDLMDYAAIRLFVDRARAVKPDFQLTPENTNAVIETCRKLDGLPLAIELAAARLRTFTPQVMLKEFEHRFDWLAPNNREEQSSKQTLRGAIEWSYNLLSEKEQILLRRLSVFSGGRTVETAKAICADDGTSLHEDEIFDLLIQLNDKSLLFAETQDDETRFNFLETIHEFAREKLKQADEEIPIRNRHLAYFCQMAERFEIEIEGSEQTEWLDRIESEHNNMRAALDWSLKDEADLQTGIRLAASLGLFWYLHSHFVEGLERSKTFLQKAREYNTDGRVLAKLLFRTADLHLHQAESDQAMSLGNEAVSLSKQINDKPMLAWALYVLGDIHLAMNELKVAEETLIEGIKVCDEIGYDGVKDISLLLLGTILLRQGELLRAHETIKDGLELAKQLSDPWSIASGLQTLGEIYLKQKKYLEARAYFEQSLDASRVVGDKVIIGNALVNLAVLTNLQGQYEASDNYAEEALSIFQLIGDETQQPFPMRIMGYAAIHAGNLVRARVLMRESLLGNVNLKNQREQLTCLIGFAHCALAEKDVQEATKLCALIEKIRQDEELIFHQVDQVAFELIQKQSKKKLGKAKYESIYKQGKALNLEDTLQRLMK